MRRVVVQVSANIVRARRDTSGVPRVGIAAVGGGLLANLYPVLVAAPRGVWVVAQADRTIRPHVAGRPLDRNRLTNWVGSSGRRRYCKRRGIPLNGNRLVEMVVGGLSIRPQITANIVRARRDPSGVPRVGIAAVGGGLLANLDPVLVAAPRSVWIVAQADRTIRSHVAGRPLDLNRLTN